MLNRTTTLLEILIINSPHGPGCIWIFLANYPRRICPPADFFNSDMYLDSSRDKRFEGRKTRTGAGAFGNRLGLDEAYRFARGDEVVSSSGIRAVDA